MERPHFSPKSVGYSFQTNSVCRSAPAPLSQQNANEPTNTPAPTTPRGPAAANLQIKPNRHTEPAAKRNLDERRLAAVRTPGYESATLPPRGLATRKNEPIVATGQRKQRCCFPPSQYFRRTHSRQGQQICKTKPLPPPDLKCRLCLLRSSTFPAFGFLRY